MKTVLVNTLYPLALREDSRCGCMEQIRRCGANTGNCCFMDAMEEQLSEKEIIDYNAIKFYDEKAVFVFPASNWINESDRVLEHFFLPIENKNIQVVAVGLGIQAETDETSLDVVKRLPQKIVKSLKILSEHSVSIGVRGELTASVLEKLGIKNCKVIGCPSFYEPYRNKMESVYWKDGKNTNIVCGVTPKKQKSNEHRILELAYESKNYLVLQSMSDLPLTIYEGKSIEQRQIDDRFPGLKLLPYELETYLKSYGKIFFSRKNWSEYLVKEKISFAWGSRFHGNMMAFSNGIPALWIMHDARTKELIEAMNLPYVTYEQIEKIKSVKELVEIPQYNDDFRKKYERLSLRYVEFLDENNIRHTFMNKEIGVVHEI